MSDTDKSPKLDDALDAAISRLDQYVERPLGIQSSHALKTVYPRQIAFVESKRRVLHIHVERASRHELITTYARLGDLERELPSYFVRCHKSFLVNLNFVDEVRREAFSLSTGDEVPISRPRKDEMQQAYIAHMRTLRR